MRTIQTLQEAGPDKTLRFAIPVEEAGRRYRVVIVLAPEEPAPRPAAEGGWPPGFIEQTAGAWQGEFVLDSEGPYEQREEL
jgi:hypothetical protein